jgi:hypothetical protein
MFKRLTALNIIDNILYLPSRDDNYDTESVSEAGIIDVSKITLLYTWDSSPSSRIPSNDVSKRARQLSITDNDTFLPSKI